MPAVRPTFFSRPDVLRKMNAATVRALLEPFEDYLSTQGIVFPIELETEFHQNKLASALSVHTAETPPELVERLEMIALLHGTQSTLKFEEDYAELLAECRGENDSPADVAVKMFLRAPHIVWREFDRQAAKCQRTFSVFRPAGGLPLQPSSPDMLERVERLLGPWFARNARTNWCRVRQVDAEDGITFLVYHGDLMNRVTVIADDGTTRSELFRPERLDIVRYRREGGEWLVSGNGSKVRDELRKAFGSVFHCSATALREVCEYSLEPLLRGKAALDCAGSKSIMNVSLSSVVVPFRTGRMVLDRGDVMDMLMSVRTAGMRIDQAELIFRIVGLRYPVRVTIDARNGKLKSSSQIPAIEQWIEAAGFRKVAPHAPEQALLDIA